MNFLFLMDPIEQVVFEKDTSFMFMLEAQKRGYNVYYLPKGGIFQRNGKIFFHVTKVIPQANKDNPFIIQHKCTLKQSEVDSVFIRTDPPFDLDYLMSTWLLDLAKNDIAIINDPTAIRTVNEKVWAMQFVDLIPKTLLTRHKDDMFEFLAQQKKIVVKPTDGFGGQSIFILEDGASDVENVLKNLSHDWRREIILQEFVKESEIGDKRILLLNGEPLGAVLRVHKQGQHINNFFQGGTANKIDITKRELEIISILKPHLQKLGLYFVGIDIMGDKLIEVNVTSPTCVQEINRLNGVALESNVIDFAENLIDQIKSKVRI